MGDGLIEAALRCIARWGVAKTSLDDVAREARCSRATVYRTFPGGKDALFDAVVRAEIGGFLERISGRLAAAADLEGALVAAITEAGRTLEQHAALQYLLVHEPELVLPHLAFRRLDEVLAEVRLHVGPLLAPFLGGDEQEAGRVAEWAARITLSYTLSPADGVDTADEASVRRLVRAHVLPGVSVPARA